MVIPWGSTHLHRRADSLEQVLDESLGIYGTQPTGNLELLARFDGYRPEMLAQLLGSERSVVRLRCLRGSSILIPTHHLPVVQGATRARNAKALAKWITSSLQEPYERWVERIDEALTGRRLTASELRTELGGGPDDKMIRYVAALMSYENRLVAADPSPRWRSDAITYARWEDWLPDVDVWSIEESDAQVELARVYLDRFGPATIEDFSFWSGIPKTKARPSIEAVAEPWSDDSWITKPPEDAGPPPLRLLPIWDTLFVTYRDRSRFLADEHYSLVYDASGNATTTVLDQGRAVGVWDLGSDDDELEILIAPFGRFTKQQRSAIDAEAARIGEMIGSDSVTVREVGPPLDLTKAPRNRFMSPLKKR